MAGGDEKKKGFIFEPIAVTLARMIANNIDECDLTRRYKDGGRDAVGTYRIGMADLCDSVEVEFALEAKCYGLETGCGVSETKRLLSRLRHRQFGIFVTTSYVSPQAYKEIIEDQHPILIISGGDICKALVRNGHRNVSSVKQWLKENFAN